jgi:hypothetical protein
VQYLNVDRKVGTEGDVPGKPETELQHVSLFKATRKVKTRSLKQTLLGSHIVSHVLRRPNPRSMRNLPPKFISAHLKKDRKNEE